MAAWVRRPEDLVSLSEDAGSPGVSTAGYVAGTVFGAVFMAAGASMMWGLSRDLDDRWARALEADGFGAAEQVRAAEAERAREAEALAAWQARDLERQKVAGEGSGPKLDALREAADDWEPAAPREVPRPLPEGAWGRFTALSARHRTKLFAGLMVAPVFFVPGLFIAAAALASMLRERGATRAMRDEPSRPWLHRSDWAARRARCATTGSAWGLALMLFVFGWAAACASVMWWLDDDVPFGLTVVVFVADLCAVLIALLAARRVRQSRKFGHLALELAEVPFVPGRPLAAKLEVGESLAGATLHAKLKLQKVTTSGSGKNRHTHFDTVFERALDAPVVNGVADLRFELPSDQPATHYGEEPGFRWSIDVSAQVPGVDYEDSFEIPVYVNAQSHS